MLFAALTLTLSMVHPALAQPIAGPMPPIAAFPAEPPPAIQAASWAAHDADSDVELASLNGDTERSMASVTKIMTALITAERLADWSVVAPISAAAQGTPIGFTGQPRVIQGDTWTVRDLLANVMVQSGNDAAVAVAEAVAGSEEAFVDLMNQRAEQLGMSHTAYQNPNGLDRDGHYSSARDLVKVSVVAIEHRRILDLTSIKQITFDPVARPEIEVTNTNRLLGVFPGLFGLKTGDTARANKVLVGFVDTGSRRLITVVMGSNDHMEATQRLMGWALESGGVRDHFYAHAMGTPAESLLPEWLHGRLLAAASVDDGQRLLPAFGSTPGERRAIEAAERAAAGLERGDG